MSVLTAVTCVCRCWPRETSRDVSYHTENSARSRSSWGGRGRRRVGSEPRGDFSRDSRLRPAGGRTDGIPAPHGGSSKSDPPNPETLSACSHMLSWAPCGLALRIYTTPIFWETYRLQMFLRRLCIFWLLCDTLYVNISISIYICISISGWIFLYMWWWFINCANVCLIPNLLLHLLMYSNSWVYDDM